MTIAIAHISDLHLKGNQETKSEQLDQLARSLCSYECKVTDVILAITGDIAFSGKQDEYDVALKIIGNWRNVIEQDGMAVHVVSVPGNHDCDFTLNTGAREALISCARSAPAKADESVIQLCCMVQARYGDFERQLGTNNDIVTVLNNAGYACQVVATKSGKIAFHLLNTAWCSQINEQPAALVVPAMALQKARRIGGCLCEVALMHHSLQWLEPSNAREVRSMLDRVSEFVLTGHDHCRGLRGSTDITQGLSVTVSEGAVLFDGENRFESGYSVLLIDSTGNRYGYDKREWEKDHYHSANSTTDWQQFYPDSKDGCGKLVLRSEWRETLSDPGASFKHPRLGHLHIEDIYVAPDLNETGDDGKKKRLSARELSFQGEDPCHILLTGVSPSGKTTLCYRVFDESYRAGLTPVYINMATIRVKNMPDFQKATEKAFAEQYADSDVDVLRQMSKENVVILADNVHRLPLNAKYRQKLLHDISSAYPKVLFTGDPLLSMEELTENPEDQATATVTWRTLQILPFSNVLRSDLITRWIELGQAEAISHQDLTREHDELKLTMDSVLGRNLIPSYPMFLLMILQRYDDEIPHDIQSSAYGYYYEYLITRTLRGIAKRNEEIDAYYNYITDFAFYLFQHHLRSVTESQLEAFHRSYCDLYRIRPSFADMSSKLVKAEILAVRDGMFRFRYAYVYYFFLARHLAHHITETSIRECISKMCARIHQDEFSNVIMFLTHLSKDPFVLEQVIATARDVFPGEETEQFQQPNLALLDLLADAPSLVLKAKDVKEERRKALEARDQIEPPDPNGEDVLEAVKYDIEEDIKDPDSIEHFIMSIKVIRLLGQILRNYYGSLKADPKLMLAEETYMLAFRAIHRFHSKLVIGLDELVEHIAKIVVAKDWDDEKKRRFARRILFSVSVWIPEIYIHEVAHALATRNLAETFEQVVGKLGSPGARLIDVAIKIACQHSFPLAEATALAREVKDDVIASMLLKGAVLQHLYLFPRTQSERQSICDGIGIPVEERQKLLVAGR